MIEPLAVLALVLAALSVALHFIPAKDIHSASILKAQTDVDDVWTWITDHLKGHVAPITSAPSAPTLAAVVAASPANAPLITHPVLTPATPQEAAAGALSWQQTEYLKALDPKMLAAWCAALAALPACAGTGESVGWITNLSVAGKQIFIALVAAGVTIPDVDPRL
jgi:hypothetical protein